MTVPDLRGSSRTHPNRSTVVAIVTERNRNWGTLEQCVVCTSAAARQKLTKLRSMYEPYIHSMGKNLMVSLPPWKHPAKTRDNWQAGPWDRVIQAKGLAVLGQKPATPPATLPGSEDHF